MGLEQGPALVEGDGILEGRLAGLQLADNALELGEGLLEGEC